MEKTKRTVEGGRRLIARCRELTMGCWWSSRYYPKPRPRWNEIASELRGLRAYPGVPTDLENLIRFAEVLATRSYR